MSNLRTLRKRIQSTQNVKEITKAMEMGAAAKLHKAQVQAEHSRPYHTMMKEILDKVASAANDLSHPLLMQRKVHKTALVVVGSDKGLCGPYNTNLYHATEKFLSKYTPEEADLILIGHTAIDHFRRRAWPIRDEHTDWVGKATFSQIRSLTFQLVHWFLDGVYDEIWIAYTDYITVFSNKVVVKKFLNINIPQPEHEVFAFDYIFEPNPEEILAELLAHYTFSQIQNALYEAYASELASRIVAMRAATKNANEMIESLTLQRNKMRQAGITREMIEIASGVESLNKG
ncbi:MAG: ATP synthase F1 subunit gamma [Chlamydiales bacterium]|nr:ATP synthase F1 subunit gamma [Chlamydiales bacterium]